MADILNRESGRQNNALQDGAPDVSLDYARGLSETILTCCTPGASLCNGWGGCQWATGWVSAQARHLPAATYPVTWRFFTFGVVAAFLLLLQFHAVNKVHDAAIIHKIIYISICDIPNVFWRFLQLRRQLASPGRRIGRPPVQRFSRVCLGRE